MKNNFKRVIKNLVSGLTFVTAITAMFYLVRVAWTGDWIIKDFNINQFIALYLLAIIWILLTTYIFIETDKTNKP